MASLFTILSSSSSTKSVSCLGQCPQSLSPTWFLSTSFLYLLFPCPSSLALLSFPSLCRLAMVLLPKAFHLDCLSSKYALMVPATPGGWSKQEQARRESPVTPYGLLGPGQYKSGKWLARMQAYCRHSPSLSSPVPVTPTPSCSFLLPPGLTKNVLSTVSPFPKTLGDGETLG